MNIQRLDNSEVLKTAMQIVQSAQKNVKATMSAKEEIKNPLSKRYFLLLKEKMNSGIQVKRVGFGSKSEFEKIKKSVDIKNKNYVFHCVPKKGYRRMLLVDDSKLMFAKTINGKRYFYFTKDSKKIKTLTNYFEKAYKRTV